MLAVIAYYQLVDNPAGQEIMNVLENISTHGKTGLTPVLGRHNEHSFEVPLACWLFLFATMGFTLYASLMSFLSTGRIWPMIFILILFLLLGNSYLKMKQRKHWAVSLQPYAFSSEIKSEIGERYLAAEDQVASPTQRLGQHFRLERDCSV
jgi:hypothetical protein